MPEPTTPPGAPTRIRREVERRLFAAAEVAWCAAGGGMSDALVWRVCDGHRAYAVRRWPAEMAEARLGWITQTLAELFHRGCDFVAVPLPGQGAERWPLRDPDGASWEASPWLEGAPLGAKPSQQELKAAIGGLAALHRAARGLQAPRGAPVWSVAQRIDRLREIAAGEDPSEAADLSNAPPGLAGVVATARRAAAATAQRLLRYREQESPTVIVHGDARPDHFLLRDGRLSGVVDFGAMRVDLAEADVARLAGELAAGDRRLRDLVVDLYAAAAGPIDRQLVAALDQANAVIAADNWRKWLAGRDRGGWDQAAVTERLRSIAMRLPAE
ncbi:aminoglycoside phosphotransferase family protein [Botrimarina sp.]|uniref:aminoglycoside phosphotransferase family protein n=1 Tax=Botrimarina sp. TaxID=2795802 RepID=UPI0032ED1D65